MASSDTPQSNITIVLDLASLETVKNSKGEFQLLNSDDHRNILLKNNRDPAKFRPDIVHQEIMAVLDSPLNKSKGIRLLVHTEKDVLIEISHKTRIPRTFKRFSGLMVQLLHQLKIRSADGKENLLKVIKNPISRHLPPGVQGYAFSKDGKLQTPTQFAHALPKDTPIVFVIGAMATGSVKVEDHPYVTKLASISKFPLSGVVALNRILGAYEELEGAC